MGLVFGLLNSVAILEEFHAAVNGRWTELVVVILVDRSLHSFKIVVYKLLQVLVGAL